MHDSNLYQSQALKDKGMVSSSGVNVYRTKPFCTKSGNLSVAVKEADCVFMESRTQRHLPSINKQTWIPKR